MSQPQFLQLGKSGSRKFNLEEAKGGIKRDEVSGEFHAIFDAFDDGNKILTDDEITTIKNSIQQAANPDNKTNKQASVFSEKEAEAYLANNDKLKDISTEKLFSFLELIEAKSKNTISSTTDENGENVVTIYKENGNEIKETYNKLTDITEKVLVVNGKTIQQKSKNNIKTEETITDNETGDSETLKYADDGKTVIQKITTTKSNNTKVTTNFDKASPDQPVSKYVQSDTAEEEYEYVGNERRLVKRYDKTTNTTTDIVYDESGRTESITDGNKNTEIVFNNQDKEVKRTVKDGNKVTITTNDYVNNRIATLTQVNGHNMQEEVVVNGKKYTVLYDGNGHTKGVIVQYQETPKEIAKKFGCKLEDLIKVNQHLIQGKAPNQYFIAGANIIIPYEMEADAFAKANSGRLSSRAVEKQAENDAITRAREEASDKPQKDLKLTKNYSNWEELAIDLLKQQGIEKPKQNEINKMRNTLVALNSGISIPKKDMTIKVPMTEQEIKAKEKEEEHANRLNTIQKFMISEYRQTLDIDARIEFDKLKPSEQLKMAEAYKEHLINDYMNEKTALPTDAIKGSPSVAFAKQKMEVEAQVEEIKYQKQHPELKAKQYANESAAVRQVRADLTEYFKDILKEAKERHEQYSKEDGWPAWLADKISYIWNNDIVLGGALNTENTDAQVQEKLKMFEKFVEDLANADNSEEGVKNRKDFDSIFNKFTGTKFDATKVSDFLTTREKWLQKESIIGTYRYTHSLLDSAIENYDKVFAETTNVREAMNNVGRRKITGDKCPELYDDYKERQAEFNAEMQVFKAFHNIMGITENEWREMMAQAYQQGISPRQAIQNFSHFVKGVIDNSTKQQLNLSSLDEIDNYELNQYGDFKAIQKKALGSKDIVETVEKYHDSQILGGAIVSGASQMLLYAAILAVAPEIGLGALSSGMLSGTAYASSYFIVDVSDRMTNDIDNSKDLYSREAMSDIALSTGVEFMAGKLFDGILKSKIFGKLEGGAKDVLLNDKELFKYIKDKIFNSKYKKVAEDVLSSTSEEGTRYTDQYIKRFLKNHAIAGAVGSAKDGSKETFKETCKGYFNGSDVSAAFIVGFISNAVFIRFKNTNWSKQNHRIIGKFTEKAPKKMTKNHLHYADGTTYNFSEEETKYITQFLTDVKNNIREQSQNNPEILSFLNEQPDEVDNLIIQYIYHTMISEEE